jgi:ABC-type antimicrobial peptide transport system permease subunit
VWRSSSLARLQGRSGHFGSRVHDPATLIEASLTILLTALAVALLSVSKATQIDPVQALRTE